jgi:hypothetical protein
MSKTVKVTDCNGNRRNQPASGITFLPLVRYRHFQNLKFSYSNRAPFLPRSSLYVAVASTAFLHWRKGIWDWRGGGGTVRRQLKNAWSFNISKFPLRLYFGSYHSPSPVPPSLYLYLRRLQKSDKGRLFL